MVASERTSDVALLLQQGISAAKAGDKLQARQWLQQASQMEPNNETVWLWLASLYNEPADLNIAAYCLQRVVAINPNNTKAQEMLQVISKRMAAAQQPAVVHDYPMQSAEQQNSQSAPESLPFEEMKRRGIVAAKGGRREEARQYLLGATDLNDTDAETWHWLSTVVDDPEDKQIALENVLTLDPMNEVAQTAMEENMAVLEARRAMQGVYTSSPTSAFDSSAFTSDGYQSGSTTDTGQPLREAPLTMNIGDSGSHLIVSPAGMGGTSAKDKNAPIAVGSVLGGKYVVLNVSAGTIGPEYTACYTKKKQFCTLRPQKCEVEDLKKAKANYIVHDKVPYTVVPISPSGFSVRSFISQVGTLPAALAVEYTLPLLSALQAMHAKGPVFSAKQQLTPDTVEFDREGNLLLELPAGRDVPLEGATRPFLPPEVKAGSGVSPTSDIYAVGALLYFMLVGSPPPPANQMPRKHGEVFSPNCFAAKPNMPEPLFKVLAQALQTNPTERYASAKEMSAALTATGLGKAPRELSKPMMAAAAAVLVVAALGALTLTGVLKLPFGTAAAQNNVALVLPTATAVPVVVPTVPLAPLSKVTAHTVDTRRFPTNSLFFSALDNTGAFIPGLKASDIKVTDNGSDATNLTLTELKRTTDSVSVIFALDNSLLMAGKPMDDAKTAIHQFTGWMQPGDQMALITFGGRLDYKVDYTVSQAEFLRAVDAVQPSGKADIFPGIALAAERAVTQSQGGYTAMIVISNGGLPTQRPSLLAATRAANVANLPIFYVGLDKATYTADVAQQLADSTGGLAVVAEVADAGGATMAIKKVEDQLHNVYKLTYDSQSTDAQGEHTLVVNVTVGGVQQSDTRKYTVLR